MRAGSAQANQLVAGFHLAAIQYAILFHHADTETGQVIVFAFIHAGHFRGFAADQGTTCQLAALANTGYYAGGNLYIQFAGGVVIQEEQGFCSAHDKIIDAHGDQVDADFFVAIVING